MVTRHDVGLVIERTYLEGISPTLDIKVVFGNKRFGAFMSGKRQANRVVGYDNGTGVVSKDGHHIVMNVIVTKLSFHPENVFITPIRNNILCLTEDITTDC
ncbi:hypothetical protein Tco_1400402 [Tanacetum coccineum]